MIRRSHILLLCLIPALSAMAPDLTDARTSANNPASAEPRASVDTQSSADARISTGNRTSADAKVPTDTRSSAGTKTSAGTPEIYINEFLSDNERNIEDEDGSTVAWIELYHGGDEPVNLAHYGLSDDPERPWRWVFPDVTIEPGEFLLIFASGKNRRDPDGELHANFSVSRAGEQLSLTDPDGRTVDLIPPIELATDISYGRMPDGSGHFTYFKRPTPGFSNTGQGYREFLEPPAFSHEGGFYTHELDLKLSTDADGAEIRYTLDGSMPDRNSPRYDGPIRIADRTHEPNNLSTIYSSPPDGVPITGFYWEEPQGQQYKGTVVRARVYRPEDGITSDLVDLPVHRPSPVVTHSYFVDEQRGGDRYHLAVLSIVTDSLHLFDYDTGIYVPGRIYDEQEGDDHQVGNYAQRGREWERPAALELFDERGDRVLAQNIGIRIHGGGSRVLSQKTLRLYARSDYGESRFRHRIFPDLPWDNYNRLILRNSGQDFFVRSTMFRDAFMQELIGGLAFDTQAYRPAIVFINGEYWGIQNIRERYDEDFLKRKYDLDPGTFDLLTGESEADEGDDSHYQAMLDYMNENDMSRERHYAHIRTLMDVDNFLDYIAAQVFIRNVDWPGNNVDYWRKRAGPYQHPPSGSRGNGAPAGGAVNGSTGNTDENTTSGSTGSADDNATTNAAGSTTGETGSLTHPEHDGRWRWLMVDTDAGFGLLNPWRVESFDMMRHMTNDQHEEWPNPAWSTLIIRRLLENESFRQAFISRSADYMNTIFHPDHVIALIDRFEENLEPVIGDHIRRWGQLSSKDEWHYNIRRMRDFAERRPKYARKHIVKYFDLGGQAGVTVDVSGLEMGRVEVNRLTIDEDIDGPDRSESVYPWKGVYFQDVPVRLVARPYRGYRFSHWEGDGLESGGGASLTGVSLSAGGTGSGWQDFGGKDSGGQNSGEPGEGAGTGDPDTADTIWITPDGDVSIRAVFEEDPDADDGDDPEDRAGPDAHILAGGAYRFERWDAENEAGTRPDNMLFYYMDDEDPGLESPAAGVTTGTYNYSSRTRINGLGTNGIAFINTSDPEGNPGYPANRLGAAVLALDTRGMKNIAVSWTGGTVAPHPRVYHLRLQYRINGEGVFRDVTDEHGEPVEYEASSEEGHSRRFDRIPLPRVIWNKPYVELRWKYYDSGDGVEGDLGKRTQLRLADIHVTGDPAAEHDGEPIDQFGVMANYPNPFNDSTVIPVTLPEETLVSITLYDVNGRMIRRERENIRLAAGYHTIRVDASGLASGMYIYRVDTPEGSGHGKMMLVR